MCLYNCCSAFLKINMDRKIAPLFLTLIIGFFSCSSTFNGKAENKTVNLTKLEEGSLKIGVENEKVIILFNKKDLIDFSQSQIKKYPSNKNFKDQLTELDSINKNHIYNEKEWKNQQYFQSYEFLFHELLLAGKGQIFDKKKTEYLDKISYTYRVDRLGNTDGIFSLMNGEEVYSVLLALGE